MTKNTTRPNIFKISTKELSQDAFITWLLQWSNPACQAIDSLLHQCGRDFLCMVLNCNPDRLNTLEYVEAGRQWQNIDIWAEIYFQDGSKTLLIIEDKVFGDPHSAQLERYKKQAEDYCVEHGFQLACTYFKIGSEPRSKIEATRVKGFSIVSREQITACLAPYHDSEHSILRDYIDYITELQDAHQKFEHLPPTEWKDWAWVGFYQFIESNIDIITWHWVNNPSGGFWNLCLTWDYWNDHIPVYMQIEQHRLCYKIALGEEETQLDNNGTDINSIQDYVFNSLKNFANSQGENRIKRPSPLVHKGNYRTLALIDLPNWCPNPDNILNKQDVLQSLNDIVDFYRQFMRELNKNSFELANIRIKKSQ